MLLVYFLSLLSQEAKESLGCLQERFERRFDDDVEEEDEDVDTWNAEWNPATDLEHRYREKVEDNCKNIFALINDK